MEEQIKCIKSSRMLDEDHDSFTEGKIYVPFAYNKWSVMTFLTS